MMTLRQPLLTIAAIFTIDYWPDTDIEAAASAAAA